MGWFGTTNARAFKCGLMALLVVCCGTAFQQAPVAPPLSANDVSWLFPPPRRVEDLDKLISMRDLTVPNQNDQSQRDRVWSDAIFQQFLKIVVNQSQVAGTQTRIGLPADAQVVDAWFIAGIRIDAGAPGLSDTIRAQFGQSPQIRLVVQPVSRNPDGTVTVNDIAGHLVFESVAGMDAPAQAGCFPRPKPNSTEFKAIVSELVALRSKLSTGELGAKITTADLPLAVHPGLLNPATVSNVRSEMKSFLEKHISSLNLDAMAVAGVPEPAAAPWIFLAMQKLPPGTDPTLPNGGFFAVHSPMLDGQQFAEMLTPPSVLPQPRTNNLNPVTCKNAAVSSESLPIAARRGVSTSDLAINPLPPTSNVKDMLDVIADPLRSHFFNTDCVSCGDGG
jgi:hypothetical protein